MLRVLILALVATATSAVPAHAWDYELRVSSSSSRSSSSALNGKTLCGNAYVFVKDEDEIEEIKFYIDGTFFRTDGNEPWDLVGATSDGKAKPYDTTKLSNGQHTIAAHVYTDDGKKVIAAIFTVQSPCA